MSISSLWSALLASGEPGGAKRVDDEHPSDLYAAIDQLGRPGLVLITPVAPPQPPAFESVEITLHHRSDDRWALGVWLAAEPLATLFSTLCQDLIDSSRTVLPAGAGGYILSRLMRWRRLFEPGDSAALGPAELRGLIGELVIVRRCLELWSTAEVIQSWVGPLKAPQDFTLPSLRIEGKTIRLGAATTRINSSDQLDVPDATLLLSVVTLASLAPDMEGMTPAWLVSEIRDRVESEDVHATSFLLESRLAAAGYVDLPEYEQLKFRVEAVRFFHVREGFPLLRRADLPSGVADASYEIEIGACAPFEVNLQEMR